MDKYDAAITYLKKYPEEIETAWTSPDKHEAGCLFQFVTPDGGNKDYTENCGCLTMIKSWPNMYKAYWPELTEKILKDPDIPESDMNITVNNLEVFARWQRYLDKNYRSKE